MIDTIVASTFDAITAIRNPYFFTNERIYQGELLGHLHIILEQKGILKEDILLVEEPPKRFGIHNTRQRPDIILHIPREVADASPRENNFSVWALKRRATTADADDDFEKLEIMFHRLDYPLGIFINIDADETFLERYQGEYRNRLYAFAIQIHNQQLLIRKTSFINEEVKEDYFELAV
jgi:hypothetical protein